MVHRLCEKHGPTTCYEHPDGGQPGLGQPNTASNFSDVMPRTYRHFAPTALLKSLLADVEGPVVPRSRAELRRIGPPRCPRAGISSSGGDRPGPAQLGPDITEVAEHRAVRRGRRGLHVGHLVRLTEAPNHRLRHPEIGPRHAR